MNEWECDRCDQDFPNGAGFCVDWSESDYWAGALLCESCYIDVAEDGLP
jgi:hypothetical protein